MTIVNYSPFIQAASQKWGVPPNVINAVIQRESSGNPNAKSGTGPVGLMQISERLAKQYGYDPKDRLDPSKNIDMGARYIRDNLKTFNGDLQKAMVGYSEGTQGALDMFSGKKPFSKQALDSITNKNLLPLFSEQQQALANNISNSNNPIGALQESMAPKPQVQEIAPKPIMGDQLSNGALAQNNPEVQQQNSNGTEDDKKKNNNNKLWGTAALGLASMLGGKQSNSQTIERAHPPTMASSSYSPQTLAVLKMLRGIGTDIYR